MTFTAEELNSNCTYCFGNEIAYLQGIGRTLTADSHVVMIGAGPGVMALALREGAGETRFQMTIVDINTCKYVSAHLAGGGWEDYPTHYIIGDSSLVGMDMASTKKEPFIDFFIVDGDHSFEGVVKDVQAWWPLLKYGCNIMFHDYVDINESGYKVKEAIEHLCNSGYDLSKIAEVGVSAIYRRLDDLWQQL